MPAEQGIKTPHPAPSDAEPSPSSRTYLDVNTALRRAYDSAVDETIPPSMLELLEKLS
jgi:hypothetical protein